MPEEYVYKIVVDDAEVNVALDKIDRRVVALTQKMDAMFRNVGAGAGAGLQQASQQMAQASQRATQAQVQGAQRVQRANQQAAQDTVRGIQQELQARRQSLAVMDQEIQKARERRDVAVEAHRTAQSALASARQGTPTTGGGMAIDLGAISPAISGVQAAEGELGAASSNYDAMVAQREAASQQIQAITEQEAQAVAAVAESSAQTTEAAAQRSGESALEAARVQVQSSREVVQGKQEEEGALQAAANQAQQQAEVSKSAEIEKARAFEDATEAHGAAVEQQTQATEELANVSREAGEGEKQRLQQRVADTNAEVATKKTAMETAKAEHVEAKRQSEDSTRTFKTASAARVNAHKGVVAATKEQRVAEKALGVETSSLAKKSKATAQEQKEGERMFVRTSKTYGKQRQELDKLARKYGSFTVTLGKSTSELDKHEKEVYDVIKSDKQLEREIDKLTNKFGQFDASIDRATFAGGPQVGTPRTAYRQAGFAIGRAGVPGAATIGEAAAVGGVAGVAAIGVLLTIKQLIDAFQKLASMAAEAFKKIISGSIEAAKEIEVARAQFGAFFQQDTVAAEAALQRLQKLSVELGENVIGVGRAFLPEVESLDQLEEVVKIATALARFQPEQGILGARIALQEALAGEFRSLQRRFEISPAAIDKIRAAFEAGGITGGLEAIQAELARTGRSVEDLADTFSVSMGRVTERIRQVAQELGDPIIQELGDQLDAVDKQLEKLEPDLDVIASAFGEVFSRLVEIVGVEIEAFLQDFDPEPVLQVAEALNGVFEALKLVSDVLDGGASAAYGFDRVMLNVASTLQSLEGFILRVGKGLNAVRDNLLDYLKVAEVALVIQQVIPGGGLPGVAAKGYGAVALNEVQALIRAIEDSGGVDPFDWDAALEDLEKNKVEFGLEIDDMVAASEEMDGAGAAMANQFLKIAQSLEGLNEIQQQYAESQEKVNEAIKEFNIQAALKFEKILTDARRARLEFEIQAAQKSLDIERKNKEKIADIRLKYNQDIIDAAQDLIDREADIARKHGDGLLDLEDERNKKRLEAEEKYLEALEKLRDKFNFQAFEAMLANDAKQLRQIRRRQAFEEGQLKKDKDLGLTDIDDDIEDRRQKLDLALERELRDARIANARKIRDLEDNLKQQLDKQEESRRRELEQQGIAEKRKRDELNNALNKQLEDYNTWWQERYRVTSEGIAADLEAMQGYVDQANGILGELGKLGVEFDPITGEAKLSYSPATITDAESPEVKAFRDQVIDTQLYLENLSRKAGEPLPQREDVAEQLADLGLTELIEVMRDLSQIIPGQVNIEDFREEEKRLLREQATFFGGQVGFTKDDILGELPKSLDALREWVDEFVSVYSPHELPPFSLYGDLSQGPLGMSGPASTLPPSPFGVATPGGMSVTPGQMGVPPQEVLDMVGTMQERLVTLWREQLGAIPEPFTAEQWNAGVERLAESLNVRDLISAVEVAQRDPTPEIDPLNVPAMQQQLARLWTEQFGEQWEGEAPQQDWVAAIGRLVASLESSDLVNALEVARGVADPDLIPTAELRLQLLQGLQPEAWQTQLFPGLYPGGQTAPGTVPGVIPGGATSTMPGAIAGAPPAGLSGPDLLRFAGAVPGQTQFIFPSVTQAPYVVPEDADFLPDFGQLMMAFGGQTPPADAFAGMFQPQAFIPGSPAAGFDLDTWNQQLNEQVQAQAIAELAKRGEIQDTFALAELLKEKENLALAALLNEQTYSYQLASDEQIAIVEDAITRQQLALAGLQGDEGLEEDAKTVEIAIGILEKALEKMREDQATANTALALEEALAVEAAEEDKVDAVEGTTAAIIQEVGGRTEAQERALDVEVDSVQDAADEQVGIVGQQETDKTAIRDEANLQELEGNLEHAEAKQEQEEDAFAEETDLLESHFFDFLRREEDWMENDLRLLRWWLLQRQEMFNQAIGQLPGLPGGGDGPDLPGGGGGGGQASLSELQSLAISKADQAGLLDSDMRNEIMTLEYDDLKDLIDYLQSLLPGYALGGGFGPGLAVVGERGEEIVNMSGAGKIDVFKDLLFRTAPTVGVGGITHTDNSTNLGGFNIPDPRGLPPTYVRIVENMISNAIRQAWAEKL